MKKIHIAILFLLVFSLACTEQIDWELDYEPSALMVVEGKVTDELKRHEVKLSWPAQGRNEEVRPVSGALVVIRDSRTVYHLTEDEDQPGTYVSDVAFAGEEQRGYQLRIRHGDMDISAVSFMPGVRPFQNMRTYVVQQNPRLYEVHVADDNASIVRMELDWSHVPGYDTLPDTENHALLYHYSLGSVDVNRIFSPQAEHVRFPPGTIVYREKESVNRTYEEFLRGMLSETDWRGGVFDVLPGNARSNFGDEALGFFAATAVIRDTIIVD